MCTPVITDQAGFLQNYVKVRLVYHHNERLYSPQWPPVGSLKLSPGTVLSARDECWRQRELIVKDGHADLSDSELVTALRRFKETIKAAAHQEANDENIVPKRCKKLDISGTWFEKELVAVR